MYTMIYMVIEMSVLTKNIVFMESILHVPECSFAVCS